MQLLMSNMRSAMEHYDMVSDGDKIAVGISGGKDSMALLCALAEMRRFYPHKYEIHAVTLDPQFGGVPADYSQITEMCQRLQVPYTIKMTELWKIIFEVRKESNPCSLCSRMRRGALHDFAKELGCNKLALGHHMDDAVETFYMNLFQGGNIGSFQPVTYLSRKDLYLIRPLVFTTPKDIIRVVNKLDLPIVKSKCPVDGCTERQKVRDLLKDFEKDYPDLRKMTFGAMQRGHISGW